MAFSNEDVKIRFDNYVKRNFECCKRQLVWEKRDKGLKGAWHAHHIFPKRIRIDDSITNMAILCINEPENCHLKQGHWGNYREVQSKTN